MERTVAVVGASLAGLRAIETLRSEGFDGRVVLVGEELHLPYDRPPLSKQVLAGEWPPERTVLADRVKLDELRIEQRLGVKATALDSGTCTLSLDDDTTIDADAVVIATGACPRELPGTSDSRNVHVLRTLDDSIDLRDRVIEVGDGCRVVVVGAGFIGSEVASTCARLGCRVTVLEALEVPLSSALGEEIGAVCGRLHEEAGVDLRTGVGVQKIAESSSEGDSGGVDGEVTVVLSDGTSIVADVVVVGIGVVPATEWLAGSGLELDGGIVCDGALFASDRVLAAGDVARWEWQRAGWPTSRASLVRIEHWQVAAEAGVAAARSLLAGRAQAPSFSPIPYFWSDQYGARIQLLGRPPLDAHIEVVVGSLEEGKFVALYRDGAYLAAAIAIGRPRELMAFRPLLVAGASWDDAIDLFN